MKKPIRGFPAKPDSLRNSGWRPPLIEGKYLGLAIAIAARPEYQGKTLRHVVQDALRAIATPEEITESLEDN